MSTRDTLTSLGLLAVGGAAIAAAAGVGRKGSRATAWIPDGDGFRWTGSKGEDEVEVLYVPEIRLYLPYVEIKASNHSLTFDRALPLQKAKAEAVQAYETQIAYNDFVQKERDRKGSRATEDDLVTVPWTRRQMFEAGLYLFEGPSGPTAFWTQKDWFKRVSRWTAFAVAKHGSWEQFKRNGNRAVPCDDARFKTRGEALAHADALAKSSPGQGFEVISVLVRPSDVKGSRSMSAEGLLGVVEEAEGLVERERFGTAIQKLRSAQGGWTGDRQVYDLLARAIRVLDDESYEAVPAGAGKAVLKRIADHVRANP